MKKSLDFQARWELEVFRASGRSIYMTPRFISFYVILAVFLIMLAGSPWLYAFTLDRNLADLQSKIAGLGSVRQEIIKLDVLKKQVDEGNQVKEIYEQSKLEPNVIFAKLMPLLPSGTTIGSLSILEDHSFQVTLNMQTPVDVVRFWVNLEDSGLFQAIDINTVSLQDKPQTVNLTLKLAEAE